MKENYLRKIPSVNDLINTEDGKLLANRYTRNIVVNGIRTVTDNLRNNIMEKEGKQLQELDRYLSTDWIMQQVDRHLKEKDKPILRSAVNATGVVIHTNLGRSLLSKSAQKAIQAVGKSYSNLEVDIETGERGSRYNNVRGLLQELTGAEDCLVVNNNAAAVLLALDTMARSKEVIISRGELVEIGGSFRVPDVMTRSGAELVEVGTTNRVYITDYEQGLSAETGLLLKVHTSNYKIVGFTAEVDLVELVQLAHSNNLPVMEDIGSGVLIDLNQYGLSHEPTVQESITAGVDIITFSGDKLLGGPQAGIIVGRAKYLEQMKKNPLTRALRVDKFTLAALEATLREYRDPEQAVINIPTLRMLTIGEDELQRRANYLCRKLTEVVSEQVEFTVVKDVSRVGGGALPTEELSTYVIELNLPDNLLQDMAKKFRLYDPPIFTRIYRNKIRFDLRTINDCDYSVIIEACRILLMGV